MEAFLGKDCTADALAPGSSDTVKAQIDEVLAQVREVCPKNSFVALKRKDDGWIFVPILGDGKNRSLCTLWPEKKRLDFDVRAQPEDKSNKRVFNEDHAPTFFEGLRTRFQRVKDVGAKRLGFTA